MELLNELNKEGTTIVMVTHSQHDAGFAGRIINLFDGQVVTKLTYNSTSPDLYAGCNVFSIVICMFWK